MIFALFHKILNLSARYSLEKSHLHIFSLTFDGQGIILTMTIIILAFFREGSNFTVSSEL